MFGQIIRLSNCKNSEKRWISKISTRVKGAETSHRNKYQMPNMEELMDTVGQTISERKPGDVYFSTMDLTYAYGQLPLSPKTGVQLIFHLCGEKSTGTYRFRTGFYGLTTMTAEFQRIMDTVLSEFPQAHAFIDDILVVTKGTELSISRRSKRFYGN